MNETTKIPEEPIAEIDETRQYPLELMREVLTIEGVDKIRFVSVAPWKSAKMNEHDEQWEVLISFHRKTAYVCLKGEEHELVNNSCSIQFLLSITGHSDYSYNDLKRPFRLMGFSVKYGSSVVND